MANTGFHDRFHDDACPLQCHHCNRKLHWKGNSFWDCKRCRKVLLCHQPAEVESQIQQLHDAFQRYPVLHLVVIVVDTEPQEHVYTLEPDTVWAWLTDNSDQLDTDSDDMNRSDSNRRVSAVQLTFFDHPQSSVVIPLGGGLRCEWIHNDQDPQRQHFYVYTPAHEVSPTPSKKRKDMDEETHEESVQRPSKMASSAPIPPVQTITQTIPDQWLIHQFDGKKAASLIQWATRLVEAKNQ